MSQSSARLYRDRLFLTPIGNIRARLLAFVLLEAPKRSENNGITSFVRLCIVLRACIWRFDVVLRSVHLSLSNVYIRYALHY